MSVRRSGSRSRSTVALWAGVAGASGLIAPPVSRADTAEEGVQAARVCQVRGAATLRRVEVAVEGDRPVRLSEATGQWTATVPTHGRVADVEMRAPVVLRGISRGSLPYVLAQELDVARGVVHLSRLTRVDRVSLDPDGAVKLAVSLAPGVRVRDLTVTCDALGLGERPLDEPIANEGPGFVAKGKFLRFFAQPGGEGDSVVVHLERPARVVAQSTAQQERWLQLWLSLPTGAGVRGWVSRGSVREVQGARGPRAAVAPPPRRRVAVGCEPPDTPTYRGPAKVAPGTQVLTAANGSPWARFAGRADVTVRTGKDEAWVAVETVSGLAGEGRCVPILSRAWVPRSAVTLPKKVEVEAPVPALRSSVSAITP